MFLALMISMLISVIASEAWSYGWFWPFLLVETILVIGLYAGMRHALAKMRWKSAE
jgi:hypothetical protein